VSSNQAGEAALLNDLNFPSVNATAGGLGPAVGGRWAGASSSTGLGDDNFPALPGTSKSARRRAKSKQSAADVVGHGGSGRVRVLNVASQGAQSEEFPSLQPATAGSTVSARDTTQTGQASQPAPRQQQQRPPQQGIQAEVGGSSRGPGARLQRSPSSQDLATTPLLSVPVTQFPPLSLASSSSRTQQSARTVDTSAADGEARGGQVGPGVSDALREANKALIGKIRSRIGSEDGFAEFKNGRQVLKFLQQCAFCTSLYGILILFFAYMQR
jgi:hypothetical protein